MLPDRAPIPRRTLKEWAREQLLSFIDDALEEGDTEWDADDERALKNERNRIAKFLRVP